MAAGQTFREHLIELAEAPAGITVTSGSVYTPGVADLPTDAYELDKLKRKYNEGLRLVGSSNPSGWYCLRRTVTIQLDPASNSPHSVDPDDPTVYRLPDDVSGDTMDEWEWEQVGSTLSGTAATATWSHVDALLATDLTTSWPRMVAVQSQKRQSNEPGVGRNWWRVRVYPRPDLNYLLKGNFYAAPDGLIELDDRHPFGSIHDPMVLAAARWCWVKNDSADARFAQYKIDFYGDGTPENPGLLNLAIAIDRKNAPPTLSNLGPRDPHAYNYSVRTTTINGVSIL